MSWVMVDIEASGPLHGTDRMTEFGAIIVREPLVDAFHGILEEPNLAATSNRSLWKTKLVPQATDLVPVTIIGTPETVMRAFSNWLDAKCVDGKAFIADNNGFDWGWINWYSWTYLGEGVFGHSSQNLGSIYKGLVGHMGKNFKHLRVTPHTHNPVDDAFGNAECLLHLKKNMGLNIKLV